MLIQPIKTLSLRVINLVNSSTLRYLQVAGSSQKFGLAQAPLLHPREINQDGLSDGIGKGCKRDAQLITGHLGQKYLTVQLINH